jgi:Xaa-Pro aminopeptidase
MAQLKSVENLDQLNKLLQEGRLEAIWFNGSANIRYLTGFTGSTGFLLLTKEKKILITDFRYEEQARKEVKEAQIELVKSSYLETLADLVKEYSIKTLGFEADSVTYQLYRQAKEAIFASFTPLDASKLRGLKTSAEIEKIGKAISIAQRAFKKVLTLVKPGVSEKDLSLELEYQMKKSGAEGIGFDVIVASGANSSKPHAKSSNKKIKRSELVLFDWGCSYQGYHCDLSRTLVVGKADDEIKQLYQVVEKAQKVALGRVQIGRRGSEVDASARLLFSSRKLESFFGHNLGHGLGLEIHEFPTLGPKSEDILRENMVFTLEPGIYLKGVGGIRIEDNVVLKKGGAELLSSLPRNLIEL